MIRELSQNVLDRATPRLRQVAARAERRVIEKELKRLNLSHADGIHTWTRRAELEALYNLARQCPSGGTIVELGSYLGASTCYLAAGAAHSGARIICVDLWNNETITADTRDTFTEFQQNVASAAELLTIIRKRTQDLTTEEVRPPIHLAFIDADHSYEATKADAAFLIPLMAPDGVIAFHDTTTFAGVSRALAEVLLDGDWCLGGQAENLTWLRRAHWSPWPPEAVVNGAATHGV